MRRRPRADQGAVTAELAIALVSVGVVLAALSSVVVVAVAQVTVTDAAAAGARLAARGESDGVVRAAAVRLAGPGSRVSVRPGPTLTTVSVHQVVALLLPGRPTVVVDAEADAVTEAGAATGSGAAAGYGAAAAEGGPP